MFAPDFQQRLDVVNTITFQYGAADPRPTTDAYHHDSRFSLGVWAESYDTNYVLQIDAQTKADRIVRRQGWPPVLMPAIDVLLNRLDADTLTAVHGATGRRQSTPAAPTRPLPRRDRPRPIVRRVDCGGMDRNRRITLRPRRRMAPHIAPITAYLVDGVPHVGIVRRHR